MALKSKIRRFFLRKGEVNRDFQSLLYNNEFPNKVLYSTKTKAFVNKADIISDTVSEKVFNDDNESSVESFQVIYENQNKEDDDTPVIKLLMGSTTNESFAIPDGQAMDPLAPTALAISNEFMERIGSGLTLLRGHGRKVQKYVMKTKVDILRKSWKYVVNITLVDAIGLPDGPDAGSNGLYCKFRLGGESHKSKLVAKSTRPSWREGFNLYLYEDSNLEVSVWHKGKQKNFMGRCILDLTRLEKEKTHELWQELDCGYGTVHMLVTVSGTARPLAHDGIPTTNGVHPVIPDENKYAWYRLNDEWSEVGQLSVVVHSAKGLPSTGLSGRPDAYCVLELDNARVQTHCVRGSTEPTWKKCFTFGVNDVTSTLDISLYDESIISSMKADLLGKISIPLLRINNEEKRWYALKNRSKTSSARGNCPRLLLEMTMVWNPVKASLRVLTPKETKYLQKPPKFNIPLIYSNLEFIKKLFDFITNANEVYKRLFEWESNEKSAVALAGWLIFWYLYRFWMLPLLLLLPFLYNWSSKRTCNNTVLVVSNNCDEDIEEDDLDSSREEKKLKNRINGLQDLTLTIKNSIDYIVSFIERLHNLANFTVPYLSYLAIAGLLICASVLFVVPANYLFMLLGVYKFTRKFMNPERTPNNDVLDFVSRVPDNIMLKEWRELKVPEPNINRRSEEIHKS